MAAALMLTGLASCSGGSGKGLLPNVSGKAGEVIVVIEKADWEGALGNEVREILAASSLAGDNWPDLKNTIKDEVHRFIFDKIKRNPMILPIILDV